MDIYTHMKRKQPEENTSKHHWSLYLVFSTDVNCKYFIQKSMTIYNKVSE